MGRLSIGSVTHSRVLYRYKNSPSIRIYIISVQSWDMRNTASGCNPRSGWATRLDIRCHNIGDAFKAFRSKQQLCPTLLTIRIETHVAHTIIIIIIGTIMIMTTRKKKKNINNDSEVLLGFPWLRTEAPRSHIAENRLLSCGETDIIENLGNDRRRKIQWRFCCVGLMRGSCKRSTCILSVRDTCT